MRLELVLCDQPPGPIPRRSARVMQCVGVGVGRATHWCEDGAGVPREVSWAAAAFGPGPRGAVVSDSEGKGKTRVRGAQGRGGSGERRASAGHRHAGHPQPRWAGWSEQMGAEM